jgi:hypothetical protein
MEVKLQNQIHPFIFLFRRISSCTLQYLRIQLVIREISDSVLVLRLAEFSQFFEVPQGKCWDSTLKLADTSSTFFWFAVHTYRIFGNRWKGVISFPLLPLYHQVGVTAGAHSSLLY